MEQLEKLVGGDLGKRECPNCHSKKIVKAGTGDKKYGSPQRYFCKECKRRFGNNSNIPNIQSNSRQLCAIFKEAKKLDSATGLKTVVGEEKYQQEVKGRILQFEIYRKNDGKEQTTIDNDRRRLQKLAKEIDIDDSESVKAYITTKRTNNTKAGYVVTYSAFLKWQGKTWKAPKYRVCSPIPEFIPTEEEIDQLIAGCGEKTSVLIQTIKETGMRGGEVLRLTWTSLNEKDRILTINKPEKRGLPRQFNISDKLVMMLERLPKKNDLIFGGVSDKDAGSNYNPQRKKLAKKLGNPRLAKINLHLIRHWYGTMLYHKTHDLDLVRRKLGHGNSASTQIYVNMEQVLFAGKVDEYDTKLAFDAKEACKLIDVGFEYVTGEYNDGGKIFRKRK